MNPAGRSAIVTGAAGGLGAATARHLSQLDMSLALLDVDAEGVASLADELPAASAVAGDANDEDAVCRAIEAASRRAPLALVVNIAGGGIAPAPVVDEAGHPQSQAPFEEVMQRNAFATFNVTRLAAAAMAGNEPDAEGERGVIVNTGSVSGLEGQAGQVAYAAAKAAVLGLTLPLARDLATHGIRVCAIAPGVMGTPLLLGARESIQRGFLAGVQFPPRMGRPEEFARAVEFIATSPYLNGENIRLDAGLRLAAR